VGKELWTGSCSKRKERSSGIGNDKDEVMMVTGSLWKEMKSWKEVHEVKVRKLFLGIWLKTSHLMPVSKML
jgi:hypothetical protein